MAIHPGSILIQQNWTPNWQGLWVAATATQIVGENANYDLLIQFVRAQPVQLQDVSIVFFPDGIFQ